MVDAEVVCTAEILNSGKRIGIPMKRELPIVIEGSMCCSENSWGYKEYHGSIRVLGREVCLKIEEDLVWTKYYFFNLNPCPVRLIMRTSPPSGRSASISNPLPHQGMILYFNGQPKNGREYHAINIPAPAT